MIGQALKVRVLEPKILVKRLTLTTISDGGIEMPTNSSRETSVAIVVASSNAARTRGIHEGDYVLIPQMRNQEIPMQICQYEDGAAVPVNVETLEMIDPQSVYAIYMKLEVPQDMAEQQND